MNETTKYHCKHCKDMGLVVWRDSLNITWAHQCNHPDPGGRYYSFPKGTWVHSGPVPPKLNEMIENHPEESKCILISNKPKYAAGVALQAAHLLKHLRPRYIDAMHAPNDFNISTDSWVNAQSKNGMIILDSVDRRLRPPQVRAVVDLMHHQQRPIILIGDSPSQHPNNEPWLALSTELHRKQTEVITI